MNDKLTELIKNKHDLDKKKEELRKEYVRVKQLWFYALEAETFEVIKEYLNGANPYVRSGRALLEVLLIRPAHSKIVNLHSCDNEEVVVLSLKSGKERVVSAYALYDKEGAPIIYRARQEILKSRKSYD